jgi:hypothetical protein
MARSGRIRCISAGSGDPAEADCGVLSIAWKGGKDKGEGGRLRPRERPGTGWVGRTEGLGAKKGPVTHPSTAHRVTAASHSPAHHQHVRRPNRQPALRATLPLPLPGPMRNRWLTRRDHRHPLVRAPGPRDTPFRVFRVLSRPSRSKRLVPTPRNRCSALTRRPSPCGWLKQVSDSPVRCPSSPGVTRVPGRQWLCFGGNSDRSQFRSLGLVIANFREAIPGCGSGDRFPGLTATPKAKRSRTGVADAPRDDRQAQPGVSTENDTQPWRSLAGSLCCGKRPRGRGLEPQRQLVSRGTASPLRGQSIFCRRIAHSQSIRPGSRAQSPPCLLA